MTENRSFLYNTNELSLHSKQVLYTVCFVILCFIDQIKNSATLIPQEGFVNLTGLCIAAIILSHFKAKDFFSLPYLIWIIYFFCGVFLNRKAGLEECDNAWQWYTAAANVGVFGLIAIRLILGMITKKERPQLNLFFFPLWCIIMIGMLLSRHDAVWPLWFFVMFGCFYLTNFTKEEWEVILKGLMNGIIIGFFLLQGFACMFRAFEILPRYCGLQLNGNMYALFCLLAATSLLGKLCQFHQENASVLQKAIVCAVFGIVTAFLLLPIGRTALITLIITFFFSNIFLFLSEPKYRLFKAFFRMAALIMAVIIVFPSIFYCVRWIQPEFDSPLIIADDAYKNAKIRTDSPEKKKRYIEFDYFMETSFGRFDALIDAYNQEFPNETSLFNGISQKLFPMQTVAAAPWDDLLISLEVPDTPYGSGTKEDPYFPGRGNNSIAIRKAIYHYYIQQLNKAGHIEADNGFWLSDFNFVPHAHDIYLQFSFNFGYIIGSIFVLFLLLLALYFIILVCFSKKWSSIIPLLFLVVFIGFGIFEIDWRIGHLSFTLLFLVAYLGVHRPAKSDCTI